MGGLANADVAALRATYSANRQTLMQRYPGLVNVPQNMAHMMRQLENAIRLAEARDWPALLDANALAVALAPSSERRLETTAQGSAFVSAARGAWDCEPLRRLAEAPDERIAYPIAVAAAASGHGLAPKPSVQAFTLALIANLVSAAVRLGLIGQSDGQKILAALLPHIRALANEAANASLSDLGGSAFRSDIAAMRHETQYSRLFRS